jgi:hypothetical protein
MTAIREYIKKLPISVRIMIHCIGKVITHPSQLIVYTGNPIAMPDQTPVPWLVSVIVMTAGIVAWCIGEKMSIAGLSEAARAMVYIPLSYMFGKSTGLADAAKIAKKSIK